MGPQSPLRIYILGVPVSAINITIALEMINEWIINRTPNYVCIRDVHGVMKCRKDKDFQKIHEIAGMVTPDGMPLVWSSHLMGYNKVKKVSGADLMDAVFACSAEKNYRHFFYGGAPGIAEKLEQSLKLKYPGVIISGTYCPPFRALTQEEELKAIQTIKESKADIVWVGLGSPKQEFWMSTHIELLETPVLVGVGAAFDFLSGTVNRAPVWMQRSGLEWLHRLASEPRRLWRRYIIITPQFVPLIILQLIRSKIFSYSDDSGRSSNNAKHRN